MWGQSERRSTLRQKNAWQSFSDSQILTALEKFLPENQRSTQTSKIKQFEIDMNVDKHQVCLNFGKHLGNESTQFINQLTEFQLRFTSITREEPIGEADEVHLLREFAKSVRIEGLPEKYLKFLRTEIKKEITGCKFFLEMLETLQNLISDKLDALITADEFLPRSYASSSSYSSSFFSSTYDDKQDKPKSKKTRKHDNASATSWGPSAAGDAGKCQGCGWDTKNTKKKGVDGPQRSGYAPEMR